MAKKSPREGPGEQGMVKKSVARPKVTKPAGRTAKAVPPARTRSARPGTGARRTEPKPAEPKEVAARKVASARKTGTPRPTARSVSSAAKARKDAVPARRRPAKSAVRAARGGDPDAAPQRPSALSEEDEIQSAKYLPRDLPPRLFEEERFLFPESYGQNRIRLLVKDPDWLFSHWDVSPETLAAIKKTLGERAMALARLTLRVSDPVNGGSSDILLPGGARSWYVRTDRAPRSYKAELGLTLTSGEFRRLAESNTVVTPRVGPSSVRATRRVRYGRPGEAAAADAASGVGDERAGATGPWKGTSIDATQPSAGASPSAATETGPGGASDVFRPGGASDVHGPGGASDVHRR
jgi:hypothetical protein